MIDLSKKYETRDGLYEAIHIEHCPGDEGYRRLIVVLKNRDDGTAKSMLYHESGSYYDQPDYNLVPARETVRYRVYRHKNLKAVKIISDERVIDPKVWELIGHKEVDVTDLIEEGE